MLVRLLPRSCSRLRIFLSYAKEDFTLAEKIAQALRNDGHTVFFDKHDMRAGEDFDARIRNAIQGSDRFVFLLSRHALDAGSYTLTELRFARERWPGASGGVLPVIIDKGLDLKDVPAYLTSVHVFQPEGNIPAETASEIAKGASVNRFCKTCAGFAAAFVFCGAAFLMAQVLGPSLRPIDVALLPFEHVHFRPRAQPPPNPGAAGAPTAWTKSPATVTLMNVSYAHRTDAARRARVLSEEIEVHLGSDVLRADWTYFVDMRTVPPCPGDWLCVKTNAAPETLEPGKTSPARETMFLFPDDRTIAWGNLLDRIMTADDDMPVKVVLRARVEVPRGGSVHVEQKEVVCDIDTKAGKADLLRYYKPGQDPRPIFWQPRCEKDATGAAHPK